MKISIAMATYNGERWIKAQLDSLVDQSRVPDELIITDDRSKDRTIEIAREFAKTAPFPVIIEVNETNLGVRGNFARAVTLCTGDIVLLCDQDDVWLHEKVARLETLLGEHPDKACVMNDAILTDGELRAVGKNKLAAIRAAGLPDTDFVMGCCAGFRRDLVDITLPIPDDAPKHDSWMIWVADVLDNTLRVAEPLQYYRRWGGNDSNFFVNALEKPGQVDRLRGMASNLRRRASSNAGAERELYFVTRIAERFAERREAVAAMVGETKAAEAVAALGRRADVLRRRDEIRGMSGLRRTRAVTRLWREGGYRVSGGLKGLIKDALGSGPAPDGR